MIRKIKRFLGLYKIQAMQMGFSKPDFTRMYAGLELNEERGNTIAEVYLLWNYFSQKEQTKIAERLSAQIKKGRFIKNTTVNSTIFRLVKKSELVAKVMLTDYFKNDPLPNPEVSGHAIYEFVVYPIAKFWAATVRKQVTLGTVCKEWAEVISYTDTRNLRPRFWS
jgi:hypothetical protein